MPKVDSSVEKVIPGMPNPNRSSVTKMLAVNETNEVARRRNLYNEILPDIVKLGLQPVLALLKVGRLHMVSLFMQRTIHKSSWQSWLANTE